MTRTCSECGGPRSADNKSGLCIACVRTRAARLAVTCAHPSCGKVLAKTATQTGTGFCRTHAPTINPAVWRPEEKPRGKATRDPIGRVRDGDIRLHAHAAIAMGPRSMDEARILAAMIAAGVAL